MRLKTIFVVVCVLFCSCAMHPLLGNAPTPQEQKTSETPPTPPPSLDIDTSSPSPLPPPLPPPLAPPFHETLQQPNTVSYESAFIKMMVTLVGLVLAVFLTIWILRRLGQGKFRSLGSSREIQILEKRALSQKSMLYLVQVGTKQVLIAESQLEVRKLAILEEELPEIDEK